MTATTVQSDSTSARTDQLRDEKSSPKQPLDTLADQASSSTVDDSGVRYNIIGDSGRTYDPAHRTFFKNVGRAAMMEKHGTLLAFRGWLKVQIADDPLIL